MSRRFGTAAKQREVHTNYCNTRQCGCDYDGESHDRKSIDSSVHQQFLTDETKRARKSGARKPHRQETDRQQRHALVAAMICGEIETSAPGFQNEDAARQSRECDAGR